MFYETVNTAESWKNACIPAFSDRLPLGELRIITTFASSFLAFSFDSFAVTVKLGLLGNGLFIL